MMGWHSGWWIFPVVMVPVMLVMMVVMMRAFRGGPPWARSGEDRDGSAERHQRRAPDQDDEVVLERLRQRFLEGEISEQEYEHTLDLLLGLHRTERGTAREKQVPAGGKPPR